MAIRQLVWDMDGTLVDSTSVVPAALAATVVELGGPSIPPDRIVAAYSLGVPEVILGHFLGRTLTPAEAEVYYRRLADVPLAPYPGIVATMAALRAHDHPVAVFTGASTRAATILLATAGIRPDLVVGGDQVPAKPAPDGLHAVAAHLRVDIAQVAYIGDANVDLRAARAAGAYSCAAAWGHLHDPAEPADFTLDSPAAALALLTA